jgi:hypothetical protein
VAESFQGGVQNGAVGREDLRARVAVQGTNLHALTGSNEVFRIPLARCTVKRIGRRIRVRDEQTSLVIWSDDDEFLDALAQTPHGTLRAEVHRIQRAARRLRLLKRSVYALMMIGVLGATIVPITRWAVGGGVLSVGDRIGESALESLALPSGIAPNVERELDVMGERLRPLSSSSLPAFRVLLAGYTPAHCFSLPPNTVVVTAGLVCAANRSEVVAAAIAREVAHLENRHVRLRLAEVVDWNMTLNLVYGDTSKLRARLLDYAHHEHSPGFTADQDETAQTRASEMLRSIGVEPSNIWDELAEAQLIGVGADAPKAIPKEVHSPPTNQNGNTATCAKIVDWPNVRKEACELIDGIDPS